jgi:hypothetical protein
MTPDRPQGFTWDGEVMVPRSPRLADKAYCVGESYLLVAHEERSLASHSHEFAWLKTAWLNLPEGLADQFPTTEHLRKRALIDGGFYDETIIDAGTNAAALRVASAIRAREEFSLVIVRGPAVVIRTAKSQSRRSMNKKQFQESKTAILEIVSSMIGIAPEALASPNSLRTLPSPSVVSDTPPTSSSPARVGGVPSLERA